MKKRISILLTLVMILNIMLTFSVSAIGPGEDKETAPYYWLTMGVPPIFAENSLAFTDNPLGYSTESNEIGLSVFIKNTDAAVGGSLILEYDSTKLIPLTYDPVVNFDWVTLEEHYEANSAVFVNKGIWTNPNLAYAPSTGDQIPRQIANSHLAIQWYYNAQGSLNANIPAARKFAQVATVKFRLASGVTADQIDKSSIKLITDDELAMSYMNLPSSLILNTMTKNYFNDEVGTTYLTIGANTYNLSAGEEPTPTPTIPKYNIPVKQVVFNQEGQPVGEAKTVYTFENVEEGTTVSINQTEHQSYFSKEAVGGISYTYSEGLSSLSVNSDDGAEIIVGFRQYADVTVYYKSGGVEIQPATFINAEIGKSVNVESVPQTITTTSGDTYTYVSGNEYVVVGGNVSITLNYTKDDKYYDVTVKFEDAGGNTLKEAVKVPNQLEGSTFDYSSYKAEFKVDDKTYVFVSANPETVVVGDGSEVTLIFKEKEDGGSSVAKLKGLFAGGFSSVLDTEGDVKDYSFTGFRGQSTILKAYTEEMGTVQYAVVNSVGDAATAEYNTYSDDIINIGSIAPNSSKIVAAKITSQDGSKTTIYTFTITVPYDEDVSTISIFGSGFEAILPSEIAEVNANGGYDLTLIKGFGNYVFQFRVNSSVQSVTYALDDSSVTPAFGAPGSIYGYFTTPQGTISVGKSIYVKVVSESGTEKVYEFPIANEINYEVE